MKFTTRQEDLNRAINIASRFVSTHPSLPILSHILLKAGSGQLSVVSTNLETGINVKIGANVAESGETTVQAKTLNDIVSGLPPVKTEITEKEGMLKIAADNYLVKLPTTPPNDFPNVVDDSETGNLISKEMLRKIVQQVIFAASKTDVKPEYSGVQFAPKDDYLEAVATDGVRLSKLKLTEGVIGVEKIIIPAAVLDEVVKVFPDEQIHFNVNKEKNDVVFSSDKISLSVRLLNAEFPDFEKIIPKNWETRVVIERDDLNKAIGVAAVFAEDYKVEFKISEGLLTLSSNNPQFGSQDSTLPVKVEGSEISVAFNWRFVKDFLGAVSGKEIALELVNPISPGVFRDPKDPNFLHLIMPIKSTREQS